MIDGSGETESEAGAATPSPPDISDIEGATTGPLRQPDAADIAIAAETSSDGAEAPGSAGDSAHDQALGNSDWAAPSVDGLKEAAAEAETPDGPTELLGSDDPADMLDAGEPTARFDRIEMADAEGEGSSDGSAPDSAATDATAPFAASPRPASPGSTLSAPAPGSPAEATVIAGGPATPPAQAAPETVVAGAPGSEPAQPQPSSAGLTVSIDAKRAATTAGPSLAVSTAAATPITASGEFPRTAPAPGDPTGDAAGGPVADATKHISRPTSPPSGGDTARPVDGAKQGRSKLPKYVFLAVLGLVVLFLGAWLIDSTRTSDQVLRNTTLGATPIGGLDRDELGVVIDGLDADLASTPLVVTVDEVQIETNAAALGAEIDREVLIDAALDAGRDGGLASRPFRWISSFSSEQPIAPTYRVDAARASEGVNGVIGDALENPIEPTLAVQGEALTLSPGSNGVTVDPNEIAEVLPTVLGQTAPFAIALTPVATTPLLTDEQVEAVIVEASDATADPVIFQVLDQTAEVGPTQIRDWVRLDAEGTEPTWAIDTDAAVSALQPLFPVLGTDEQQARFEVIDGVPEILPATETVICCDPASVEGIRDALLGPAPVVEETDEESEDDGDTVVLRTVRLEPEIVSPDEGVAELESLGIIEEVSTFTTNFPGGQPRVTNIHRIADITRGVIIRPGEDFSLNGFVGRRTIENGFVADGAIANGILEPQVGGGISQFATTFFNASFFAGLEFNEYQSHSLFISRYPRGREATISFPKPDLSVNNSTDYGVLVWTSYTPTSITVTFYSTKHIDVVAGDLLRSSQGACSRYTTPRIRTYPDGTVLEDSVFAVYRPGEGLDCNGNSTRPEDQPNGPTVPEPQPDPGADDNPGTETTMPPTTAPPPPTTAPAEDDDGG